MTTWSVCFFAVTAIGCERSAPVSRSPLRIFAASSLTEAFRDLEEKFELEQPNFDAQITFAGSQVLRLQIEQGAQADVFASANLQHMQSLIEQDLASSSSIFAYNELAVIIPKSNPASIKSFSDLPAADRIVMANDHVPAGIYSRMVLEKAVDRFGKEFITRLRNRIVSEESNVRLVRAKVELGEADAAIVYQTDAVSSDRLLLISIPEDLNVRASYSIAQVTTSINPEGVKQFITFVFSRKGRRILEKHGFITTTL